MSLRMNTQFSGLLCFTFYLCFLTVIRETRAGGMESVEDSLKSLIKSEQPSTQVTFEALKPSVRNPKYAFSVSPFPADGLFRFGNFGNFTQLGNVFNGTQPFGPFDPLTTTLLVVKGGLLAMLSAAKAILPPLALIAAVTLIIAVGASFLICSTTECGDGGDNIFRRNSYEHEYDKFRPIYQAIDDDYMNKQYKYNHLSHDKEY